MCSKKAVNTVTRVGSGIVTGGLSEVSRATTGDKSALTQALNTPGNILTGGGPNGLGVAGVNAAAGLLGLNPPIPPDVPKPQDVASPDQPSTPDAPPTPNQPAPGQTTVAADIAKRRKKLSALQAGLISTMASGPAGVTTPALVSKPAATGVKLKLGQ